MQRWIGVVGLGLLMSCNSGSIKIGKGAELDGWFTSDVYTWDCADTERLWMGVFGYEISLAFAPDSHLTHNLPDVGECTYGLALFASDDLQAGETIPDLGNDPRWETDSGSGELQAITTGLWIAEVFSNQFTCNEASAIIGSGVQLVNASILNGITTPEAGSVTDVNVQNDFSTGITFGDEVDIDWDVDGWQESLVQIRGMRSGIAYETVTCNTTGLDSFLVDADIWEYLNPDLPVDTHKIYVGFQNVGTSTSNDGLELEVATRALHVVGILED